jgi:hypothetical protein
LNKYAYSNGSCCSYRSCCSHSNSGGTVVVGAVDVVVTVVVVVTVAVLVIASGEGSLKYGLLKREGIDESNIKDSKEDFLLYRLDKLLFQHKLLVKKIKIIIRKAEA